MSDQSSRDLLAAILERDLDTVKEVLSNRLHDGDAVPLTTEALVILLIDLSREVDAVHAKHSVPHIQREAAVVVGAMLRSAAVRLAESLT